VNRGIGYSDANSTLRAVSRALYARTLTLTVLPTDLSIHILFEAFDIV
jgi:hypothetical protein